MKKYKSEKVAIFFHNSVINLEQSGQFTNPEKRLVRLDVMVLLDVICS